MSTKAKKKASNEEHALLSPSGAHRWMRCIGSLFMEKDCKDEDTVYSREGTGAHWVLQMTLEHNIDAPYFYNGRIAPNGWVVTADMCEEVDKTVQFVRKTVEGYELQGATVTLMPEQRVYYDEAVGLRKGVGFGTSDIILIIEFPDGRKWLHIIDLKYGMGNVVSAVDNEQLRNYGIGTAHSFSFMGPFDEVVMTIHMPRLDFTDDDRLTMKELHAFGVTVKIQGQLALDIYEGVIEFSEEAHLTPGDHCHFCERRGDCKALSEMIAEEVKAGFDDLTGPELDEKADDDLLSRHMSMIELIETWCKGVRRMVESRLLSGETVPGYKLVQGRKGNRKWADETKAKNWLAKLLSEDQMYDKSLISAPAAEKLLKKLRPKNAATIKKLTTQSDGKLSVAPVSDDREAVVLSSVADDFDDLDDIA